VTAPSTKVPAPFAQGSAVVSSGQTVVDIINPKQVSIKNGFIAFSLQKM
jgi:hypothetical protein